MTENTSPVKPVRSPAPHDHQTGFRPDVLDEIREGVAERVTQRTMDRNSTAVPYYVRRAEEFMAAHAAQAIGMDELVKACGVSARSIYDGFQRCRNTTPMKFLKEIRLEGARDDLARAEQRTSVTDVATRWGLFHLGRFAVDYRRKFGEPPSATLRRNLR